MAFYRCMGSNGGGVTPTNITPSNSTPAAMSADGVYKATAAGYAIASYQSVTPSAQGAAFNEGIVKMSGGGYAYSSQPSAYTSYSNPISAVSSSSKTLTISNKNGSKLLVFAFITTTSSQPYDRLDGATIEGGTISKLSNLRSLNTTTYGTFYNVSVTSDSCTITAPYACLWQVFEAQ